MLRPSLLLLVPILLACSERGGGKHVFQAPPPPPPPAASSPAGTAAPPTNNGMTTGSAEAVLGTAGPDAKILALTSAATGAPVSLDGLVDSIDVLTLVARGPDERGRGASEVRLELNGARDTTLVLRLDQPAPSIVAHAFRVHVAQRVDDGGLPAGYYRMRVMLAARDGRTIAASAPMFLTVRQPRD